MSDARPFLAWRGSDDGRARRWHGRCEAPAVIRLFTRFLGRLSVSRKLMLIYLLDLSAVIYISGILINEKFIAIDFARKELAGNAYVAEVREALLGLARAGAGPEVAPAGAHLSGSAALAASGPRLCARPAD